MSRLYLGLAFAVVLLAAAVASQSPVAGEPLAITVLESDLNPDGGVYEVNTGPDGLLWVSDYLAGEIRAYAPDGSAATVYSGLGAVADARAAGGGMVWYVDQDAGRLARLDTAAQTVTSWPLPAGGFSGSGTALDGAGRVWLADFGQSMLVRFAPGSGEMCTYDTSALASGGSPYIVFDGQALWFSDFYFNALLRLNPGSGALARWHLDAAEWDFEAEGLRADGAGGLWFATGNTASLGHLDLSDPGAPQLLRYRVPSGGGVPAMLARGTGQLWYSGSTPATLGRLDVAQGAPQAYSPDEDETTLSPDCETPAAADPTAVATAEETPTWTSVDYDTSEDGGWTAAALDQDAFPWGLSLAGSDLWLADNGRQVLMRTQVQATLRACKLRDEDANAATTADQEPVEGWDMTLLLEGEPEGAALSTGVDGCVEWEGLATGMSYGVREEEREGWQSLGLSECDLGLVIEPGQYLCTFVNWQRSNELYLPLTVR